MNEFPSKWASQFSSITNHTQPEGTTPNHSTSSSLTSKKNGDFEAENSQNSHAKRPSQMPPKIPSGGTTLGLKKPVKLSKLITTRNTNMSENVLMSAPVNHEGFRLEKTSNRKIRQRSASTTFRTSPITSSFETSSERNAHLSAAATRAFEAYTTKKRLLQEKVSKENERFEANQRNRRSNSSLRTSRTFIEDSEVAETVAQIMKTNEETIGRPTESSRLPREANIPGDSSQRVYYWG